MFLILFCAVFSLHGAAPTRGADRLRELVVFPKMNLDFDLQFCFRGNSWVINDNDNGPEEISQLRKEQKQQPEDIGLLLDLGILLDENDETNESSVYYKKAEQLCRQKLDTNPRDGLILTHLGDALHELDRDQEAESVYREATIVSSNNWRCWVGLGNFLSNKYLTLFPKRLRDQIGPS